jgi:MOSC domain-containing protein YiiM
VAGTFVGAHGASGSTPVDVLALDFGGVVGDRHHGLTMRSTVRETRVHPKGTEIRNNRQVSLIDEAELAAIAQALGVARVDGAWVGANLTTVGLPDLTRLPELTRLVLSGGAVIALNGENLPCTTAGAEVARHAGTRPSEFPKAALGRRGVTGWVERPAPIRPGEAITVLVPRAAREG